MREARAASRPTRHTLVEPKEVTPHDEREGPGRRSFRRQTPWLAALALLSFISSSPCVAENASKQEMHGLDDQVQEIKSDVLSIAKDLDLLEEKLLYPSDTQVSVFVSLAEGDKFRLDSVQIRMDGADVADHIYTFKELEALQKGGVQRIYTGNVATGDHQLEVSIAGKLPGGSDFKRTESFRFSKQVKPKLVNLVLAGKNSDGAIRLGEQ